MSDLSGIQRIESAIAFIPAIDRELWVEVGMAVKSELGEAGRDIWDAWSQQAESYRPDSAKAVWRSIKDAGKVTVATLYHYAKQHGWRDDGTRQHLSARQIADRRKAAIERSAAADGATAIAHSKASARAAALLEQCEIGQHQYLQSKGFPDARTLVDADGSMIIPMRDCMSGNLLGVQKIRLVDNQWQKKMLPGMRAKGAMHRLGSPRAAELWFVEGYATGLSVDAAMRLLRLSAATIVCFSDRNLVHVASQFTGRNFVFADNDESKAGELAAWDTGLPYAMSDSLGQDANDLHQDDGLMAVAKKIMGARRK